MKREPELDAIDVAGFDFNHTKKIRDVARSGRAAIVVDDMVKLDPRCVHQVAGTSRPRGIEIRGRAEAITDPQPMIHIYPERIVSWGWTTPGEARAARTLGTSP